MKFLVAVAASIAPLSSAPAVADQEKPNRIVIAPNGSQTSVKGAAQFFTGTVRVDPLFRPQVPARTSAALVKHWHGASPTTAITHIVIQEQADGKAVDWLEKVGDEQYLGSVGPTQRARMSNFSTLL